MQYQYQDIVKLSQEGILMSDGFQISFQACSQTWKHMKKVEASTCVAERDITAKPPYFRFYTDDNMIEIVCAGKGLFQKRQSEKMFDQLRQEILRWGFSTFDMS